MAKNVSDELVETIHEWGVDTVFGLPGDGINGVVEAFRRKQDDIRFIQVRHEEAAAFMACAYAKYTGKLGVCMATSGPGAIHLLNGLYDAKMDHAPVLAITGETYSDLIGQQYQQDVNAMALFEDVAVFNQRVMGPAHVRGTTNLACREAVYNRAVSHVTVPVDIQEADMGEEETSMHAVPKHTATVQPVPREMPSEQDLKRAASILNGAKRPVILCGQGARDAADILLHVADIMGAPIIKSLLGKQVVPDGHPLCLGGIGLLGTRPSEEAMEQCDALFMVGTAFPYMEYLPKHGQAKAVQIDNNPGRIGLRYPIDVGLLGDSKTTLEALKPMLSYHRDRSWLEDLQDSMKDWWKLIAERESRDDVPIKPQVVAKHLSDLAADNAIVSTDSGTITTWIARHFRMQQGQMFSCSGNLATMAPGLPYTIAAQVAYPERQCIAFVGDGGFTMLMGDFVTAAKYNLPIKVVIIKNNVLGQIKWEQIVFLGSPAYAVELQPIDFAKFAEACGGTGIHVDKPGDIRDGIAALLAADKPALIEVVVDPNEPPMPPKVTLQQAGKFGEALLRGQPEGPRIALTVWRDKIDELIHTT